MIAYVHDPAQSSILNRYKESSSSSLIAFFELSACLDAEAFFDFLASFCSVSFDLVSLSSG